MSIIEDTNTNTLRAAAAAWRAHHRSIWLFPSGLPISIHDRIDELIDEIERLRPAALEESPARERDAGKETPT